MNFPYTGQGKQDGAGESERSSVPQMHYPGKEL